MSAEQPSQRFSGVTRHGKTWLAKFRHKGRDVNLGHYDDPELAGRVADFARYMCFGLRPANWHPNVGRPNFPPRTCDGFARVSILRQLLWFGVVEPETVRARLTEYDAVVYGSATR